MKNSLVILLLSTFLLSCEKSEIPAPFTGEYLIFGEYYGECFGNCFTGYKMEEGKIYPDELDYFYGNDLIFSDTALAQEAYNIAQVLLQEFPELLLENSDETYGCPDCHDQGGIYLQLGTEENIRKWQIDRENNALPAELLPYKERIEEVLDALD